MNKTRKILSVVILLIFVALLVNEYNLNYHYIVLYDDLGIHDFSGSNLIGFKYIMLPLGTLISAVNVYFNFASKTNKG